MLTKAYIRNERLGLTDSQAANLPILKDGEPVGICLGVEGDSVEILIDEKFLGQSFSSFTISKEVQTNDTH